MDPLSIVHQAFVDGGLGYGLLVAAIIYLLWRGAKLEKLREQDLMIAREDAKARQKEAAEANERYERYVAAIERLTQRRR